ncbi:MAG: D-alanine--D-alanine ligase [Planctomycetota bacterium]
MTSVLVLAGGPDAEREVSIRSAAEVAEALSADSTHIVHLETIDQPSAAELGRLPGDVVFPLLHGPWGEGGPLQDLLEMLGRPYVGCRPAAARLAMDKFACKLAAARHAVPTAPAVLVAPREYRIALEPPVIIKPCHDGSSYGLHVCRDQASLDTALQALDTERVWLAERMVAGREVTVAVLKDTDEPTGFRTLPIVEITPSEGVYDLAAKYDRADTVYTTSPTLPSDVEQRLRSHAVAASLAIGARHLCRVDFIIDDATDTPLMLEINTMPGFTTRSLFPQAAAAAGMDLPTLCAALVQHARDANA